MLIVYNKTKHHFKTIFCLIQVKSIAECILQYFGPSLSYRLSLRSLFCLFLIGHLRQVSLYVDKLQIEITVLLIDYYT